MTLREEQAVIGKGKAQERGRRQQRAGMARDGEGVGSNGQRASMGSREQAQVGREQVGTDTTRPGTLLSAQTGRQGPRDSWAWAVLRLCTCRGC